MLKPHFACSASQARWRAKKSSAEVTYQMIVAALGEALAGGEGAGQAQSPLLEQVQHVRRVLGDLAVELDLRPVPPHLRPSEELPDTNTLRESMPALTPPLLATIGLSRADRV